MQEPSRRRQGLTTAPPQNPWSAVCASDAQFASFPLRCVITGRHCRPGCLCSHEATASLAWFPVAESLMIWTQHKKVSEGSEICEARSSDMEVANVSKVELKLPAPPGIGSSWQFHLVRAVGFPFAGTVVMGQKGVVLKRIIVQCLGDTYEVWTINATFVACCSQKAIRRKEQLHCSCFKCQEIQTLSRCAVLLWLHRYAIPRDHVLDLRSLAGGISAVVFAQLDP